MTGETGGDCDDVAGEACHDAAFTDADGRTTFSDFEVWQDNFEDPTRESGRREFDYGCLEVEVLSMEGEETIQLEPDLTADVHLRTGDGCSPFGYGQPGVIETFEPPEPEPEPRPEPDPTPSTGGGLVAIGLLGLAGGPAGLRRRA